MQGRAAFTNLRWFLFLPLGTAFLASAAPAQSPEMPSSFDIQILLSQRAAAKLESLSEGIVIAATYSADTAPGAERHADQIGRIDLDRKTAVISGRPQFVHIAGPRIAHSLLAETHGPILLNVNVYSARRSGPDNILNCDFFDGNLAEAVRKPLTLHCSLINEKVQTGNGDSLPPIPPDRAADSYAIYSLLVPHGPSDKIAPSQIQRWAIADMTVNITDMNPAVPPDGELKAPPDNPNAFKGALEDFEARKYQRFRLEAASFHSNHTFSLLERQQVSDLRRAASGTAGITFFSAVYFNNAQTAALVYVNDWCANLCAAGQWVYLEKHGGHWERRSGIVSGGA
jgi:hypothetical protein